MSENHPAQTERLLRTDTFRGSFGGLLLFPVFLGGFGSGLFDSDPGHTLRVIQSIGILLPLFTGLLRFTTNDQSDVSERVNDYLLLGILGLVLAGVLATLAGAVTDVAGILRISLFFVFLTFTAIGIAAIDMLSGIADSKSKIGSSETGPTASLAVNMRDDESKTNASSKTASDESDERDGNEKGSEAGTELDSDSSDRGTERATKKADDRGSVSSKPTNNRKNKCNDDRGPKSEDESQGRPK